jgi:hypothetical protein
MKQGQKRAGLEKPRASGLSFAHLEFTNGVREEQIGLVFT